MRDNAELSFWADLVCHKHNVKFTILTIQNSSSMSGS